MKTHSKRKFVGNIKVDFKFHEIDDEKKYGKKHAEIDYTVFNKVFIQLEDNTVIQGFAYLVNGKPLLIPEPEPSILYFTNAESKLQSVLDLQDVILSSKTPNNIHGIVNVFFGFFQLSSDYIINLFTSIEAFNNSLIDDDFSIEIKGVTYDKKKAQKSMDFGTKTKKAIPAIMDKSFVKDFPAEYQRILEIKKLRDNVVHTKNMRSGFPASYRELYVSYLEFDFNGSYKIIKDYFNYYQQNWIEVCNCGK